MKRITQDDLNRGVAQYIAHTYGRRTIFDKVELAMYNPRGDTKCHMSLYTDNSGEIDIDGFPTNIRFVAEMGESSIKVQGMRGVDFIRAVRPDVVIATGAEYRGQHFLPSDDGDAESLVRYLAEWYMAKNRDVADLFRSLTNQRLDLTLYDVIKNGIHSFQTRVSLDSSGKAVFSVACQGISYSYAGMGASLHGDWTLLLSRGDVVLDSSGEALLDVPLRDFFRGRFGYWLSLKPPRGDSAIYLVKVFAFCHCVLGNRVP